MIIAPATHECARGIAKVHIRSWQAAYVGILEQQFLDRLSVDERTTRWEDILRKADSQTLVARRDGRDDAVVGFISYGRSRDEGASPEQGEIWALYAEPEVWGEGYGRALLAKALDELRAKAYTDVSLWVLNRNDRGVRFYKRHGFSHVEGSEKIFELGGRQVEEVCLRFRNDV